MFYYTLSLSVNRTYECSVLSLYLLDKTRQYRYNKGRQPLTPISQFSVHTHTNIRRKSKCYRNENPNDSKGCEVFNPLPPSVFNCLTGLEYNEHSSFSPSSYPTDRVSTNKKGPLTWGGGSLLRFITENI